MLTFLLKSNSPYRYRQVKNNLNLKIASRQIRTEDSLQRRENPAGCNLSGFEDSNNLSGSSDSWVPQLLLLWGTITDWTWEDGTKEKKTCTRQWSVNNLGWWNVVFMSVLCSRSPLLFIIVMLMSSSLSINDAVKCHKNRHNQSLPPISTTCLSAKNWVSSGRSVINNPFLKQVDEVGLVGCQTHNHI